MIRRPPVSIRAAHLFPYTTLFRSFLVISALVFTSGYDGLFYSIGFLVGWPIILFLMAERLRNLGKFTFSDVASYRLGQTQIRILSACGSLIEIGRAHV